MLMLMLKRRHVVGVSARAMQGECSAGPVESITLRGEYTVGGHMIWEA